jgi:hypothetical protein
MVIKFRSLSDVDASSKKIQTWCREYLREALRSVYGIKREIDLGWKDTTRNIKGRAYI